jgi:LysR family transcriptional regulator, low CO2-responsive transcriptional regulator
MLDTHQLNVFLVAAETMNFTEAARRLHLSQPSVSQHIQTLEQHFDLELFVRAGRHIQLTDAGRTLLPLAKDLINRTGSIEETMLSLRGEVYGHLVVGYSTTPGKYILPHLLSRFLNLYSKVTVTCRVASQEQAIEMVRVGSAHFAVGGTPHTVSHDVEFFKYMADPLVLIAPLNHPWSEQRVIEPELLYDGGFIMREAGSGARAVLRDGLASIGVSLERLKALIVLGNSEAVALAVKEGLGVGFVSGMVVASLVRGDVALIKVRGLSLERDIFITRSARRQQTLAQQTFWDYVNNEGPLAFADRVLDQAVAA